MWIPYSNRVRIPGLQDDDDDGSSSDSDYEEEDEQPPLQHEDEQDDDQEQPPLQHQDEQDDDHEQPPLQHQDEQDDDHEQPPLQHQDEQDDDHEQPPLQHQDQQDDDHEQPPLQHQDQPHDQDKNALSVLEHPTGNVVEEGYELDSGSGFDICETDHDFSSGSELHKNSKPRVQPASPLVPSASDVQSMIHPRQPKVNLSKLSTESLSRYCKHHKIAGINSDSSREQMLNAVQHHYVTQPPLDEVQVLEDFARASKRPKPPDGPAQ